MKIDPDKVSNGKCAGKCTLTHVFRAANRWKVGKRVRDIEQAPDGSLWMLEDASPGGLFRPTPKK